MKQKYISIIAQTIVTIIGIVMFVVAQGFEDFNGNNAYISSSYYPSIICCLIVIFGVWGIIEDVVTIKQGNSEAKFKIGNTRNLFLVLGAAVFVLMMWQFFSLFYPSIFIAVAVLMYFLRPTQENKMKHIGFCLLISTILLFLFYAIFDLALQVHL